MKIILSVVFLLLGIFFFTSELVTAQTKTFKWETEICSLEGKYDSSKYTEAQLKNTWDLISTAGAIPLFTRTSVFKYEDIVKLNVEFLDADYKEASAKLRNGEIVNEPRWVNFRRSKIKELDEFYEQGRIKIQAYQNPAVLKKYKKAPFCNDFYVEPLIKGGEYLRATWLKLNMDARQNNGSPERLKKQFEIESARNDWEEIARTYILTFGWGNCANKVIPYVENDGKIAEDFKKLFTDVKEECDEP